MKKSNALTISALLSYATECLNKSGSDSARLDAEVLLCHTINKSKTFLFTWPEHQVSEQESEQFHEYVAQRIDGVPIAYITELKDFWTLTLKTSPATLIPRPDTELLVEQAMDVIKTQRWQSGQGLDLGTGTGAIALALASETEMWRWTGVDFSEDAVQLAIENSKRNNIVNCQFMRSNWFSELSNQQFDLIVANPPYIEEDDPHLQQGDVRFEPSSALTSGKTGLNDIEIICHQAQKYLNRNGCLIIEHGYNQGEAVRNIYSDAGFQHIETKVDLAGNDRLTIGYFL